MDIHIPLLQTITGFFSNMADTNLILMSILFFVFVIFAYKTFQIVFRAIIIGTISATFPIIASVLGLGIPLNLGSIIWFGVFGAVSYITYSMITGGLKIVKWALLPFKKVFRSSPKEQHYHKTIIIRQEDTKRRKKR